MYLKKLQITLVVVSLLVMLVLSSCVWNKDKAAKPQRQTLGKTAHQVDKSRPVASTLGPDDVIEITVFREANLSGVYRVSPEGNIQFPLIGVVVLDSKTALEVSTEIKLRLADGFLIDPHVSVFVKEYNSKKIFVFGQVKSPGTFKYDENMGIVQAITLAGGFSKTANDESVSVTRIKDGVEKRIKISVDKIGKGEAENFVLSPGDIIFVPESLF